MNVWNDYPLGDMVARYVQDKETGQLGLILLPLSKLSTVREKKFKAEPLVQLKWRGDSYPGGFAHGHSMRGSGTLKELVFEEQHQVKTDDSISIVTVFRSRKTCRIAHHLIWYPGYPALESFTTVQNDGDTPLTAEMISSFSLTGLTPFAEDEAPESLILHRILSSWSAEGRLTSSRIEELDLEPAWAPHAVRGIRFGQIGSMPVRGYFPAAFVEDVQAGVTWGVQLGHPASWQIEVGRRDNGLFLSGGLADREFGHWMKTFEPGEGFQTPSAYLTVAAESVDMAAARLTKFQERALSGSGAPAVEEDLPILFNEFCTTWGSPSAENLYPIAERLRNKGIRYLVIDSGWYKKEGTNWFNGMGDWEVSEELFPQGLAPTLDHIRECGMIPGIWFEMEVCGKEAVSFQLTDHLLKRDGQPLTVGDRRFWDFRDPFVIGYLKEKVIDFLKTNGFGYLKVDYNDSLGIGCDGAESLGEGLRQQMQAVQSFFQLIREELPEIVIENCASGGHRLEPSMLGLTSMSSFSDAHECEEIPIIAANMHRVMLPRQNQIWAVIRKTDSLQRMRYSLAATMLGRMCLSGDIHELSEEQWKIIDESIAFYKLAAPVIKEGRSSRFGPLIRSYRHPKGWQGMMRVSLDGSQLLIIVHTFELAGEEQITLPLPEVSGLYQVSETFTDPGIGIALSKDQLNLELSRSFAAACILLNLQ